MNIKYLNYASDLRRIADWMARGQKEMFPLASKLWRDVRKDPKVKSVLVKYQADKDPLKISADTNKRMAFAEQTLLASIMLS